MVCTHAIVIYFIVDIFRERLNIVLISILLDGCLTVRIPGFSCCSVNYPIPCRSAARAYQWSRKKQTARLKILLAVRASVSRDVAGVLFCRFTICIIVVLAYWCKCHEYCPWVFRIARFNKMDEIVLARGYRLERPAHSQGSSKRDWIQHVRPKLNRMWRLEPLPQFHLHHGWDNPYYESRCGNTRDVSETDVLCAITPADNIMNLKRLR